LETRESDGILVYNENLTSEMKNLSTTLYIIQEESDLDTKYDLEGRTT